MSNFQYIVIGVFIFIILIAVLIFAGVIPTPKGGGGGGDDTAPLEMWGTLSAEDMSGIISKFRNQSDGKFRITYIEKNINDVEIDLLRAITNGNPPDLLIFPQYLFLTLEEHLFKFKPESFNERQFRQLFIEGSEIYFTGSGIAALPYLVDPIVLFSNRNILINNNVLLPPSDWEEMIDMTEKITISDNRGKISLSGVALGESQNVNHSKEILSSMIQQAGNPITKWSQRGDIESYLGSGVEGEVVSPTLSALIFYTDFSNPQKSRYSWNGSLPNSINSFSADLLAFYLGKASDLSIIRNLNPHINLDVSKIPQIRGGNIEATHGDIIGIGVVNKSNNLLDAVSALYEFTNSKWADIATQEFNLPPARRDLLGKNQEDPLIDNFYRSAMITKTWIDPDSEKTDNIFSEMINKINSGAISPTTAIQNADAQLEALLNKYN